MPRDKPVVVIDEDLFFLKPIGWAINGFPGFNAVTWLPKELHPIPEDVSVFLVDAYDPSSLRLIDTFCVIYPSAACIGWTSNEITPEIVERFTSVGAVAVISKDISDEELLEILRKYTKGE